MTSKYLLKKTIPVFIALQIFIVRSYHEREPEFKSVVRQSAILQSPECCKKIPKKRDLRSFHPPEKSNKKREREREKDAQQGEKGPTQKETLDP